MNKEKRKAWGTGLDRWTASTTGTPTIALDQAARIRAWKALMEKFSAIQRVLLMAPHDEADLDLIQAVAHTVVAELNFRAKYSLDEPCRDLAACLLASPQDDPPEGTWEQDRCLAWVMLAHDRPKVLGLLDGSLEALAQTGQPHYYVQAARAVLNVAAGELMYFRSHPEELEPREAVAKA